MKKGLVRIAIGSLLIIAQLASDLGSAQTGFTVQISFASLAVFLYDLVFLVSYSSVGIIGTILFVSGIVAYRKSCKKGTGETSNPPPSSAVARADAPSEARDPHSTLTSMATAAKKSVPGRMNAHPQRIPVSAPVHKSIAAAHQPAVSYLPAHNQKAQPFNTVLLISLIVSILLFLLTAAVCLLFFLKNIQLQQSVIDQDVQIQVMSEKVTNLESTVSDQAAQIARRNDAAMEMSQLITSLESQAGYFDEICKNLRSGNIGYASDNFRVNRSVIVLDKDDFNEKLTLTAYWSTYGYVNLTYSSNHASLSFDSNSWSTSTTMTVIPRSEGVTVVTFSNDTDNKTFKVLIIVTD